MYNIKLVMYGHPILDYFCFLKICFINFILKLVNYFKNPTNIEEFEHMEYICDKIIIMPKHGKFNYISDWCSSPKPHIQLAMTT